MKTISVIVPAHNEEADLPKCLISLITQTKRPTEIIIVDDGSSDNTAKIAADFALKNNNIRVITKQTASGYTAAVLFGITNATSRIVAILDADSIVPKQWIERILMAFEDEKVGCVGGPYLPSNPEKHFPALERLYLWNMYNTGKLRTLPGTNLAFDRVKANKIRLFNTPPRFAIDKYIQEQIKIMGFKVLFLRDNVVLSKSPETFMGYIRQRTRWGRGAVREHKLKRISLVLSIVTVASVPLLIILSLLLPLIALLLILLLVSTSIMLSVIWKGLTSLQATQLILIKISGRFAHAFGCVAEALDHIR